MLKLNPIDELNKKLETFKLVQDIQNVRKHEELSNILQKHSSLITFIALFIGITGLLKAFSINSEEIFPFNQLFLIAYSGMEFFSMIITLLLLTTLIVILSKKSENSNIGLFNTLLFFFTFSFFVFILLIKMNTINQIMIFILGFFMAGLMIILHLKFKEYLKGKIIRKEYLIAKGSYILTLVAFFLFFCKVFFQTSLFYGEASIKDLGIISFILIISLTMFLMILDLTMNLKLIIKDQN